jgi:hypothetical protein
MSGGGFRATLFHLGTLWRLNELAYRVTVTTRTDNLVGTEVG